MSRSNPMHHGAPEALPEPYRGHDWPFPRDPYPCDPVESLPPIPRPVREPLPADIEPAPF